MVIADFDDPRNAPIQVPTMGNVECMAATVEWSSDGIDNNGDGAVDDRGESGLVAIYAYGRCGGIVRGAEVVLRRDTSKDASGRVGYAQVSWREIGPQQGPAG